MIDEYESTPQLSVQEESMREKWERVMAGLKAPPDSGEHKYAVLALQRIFGPSSASTAVCVGVLIALMFFIQVAGDNTPPELEVTIVDPEIEELEEIIEEEIEKIEPEDVTLEPSDEMQFSDVQEIVNEAPSFGDESTDDLVPQAVDIIKSPMVIKGLYGARSGGGRAAAVGRHGGGGSALTAVLKALRWLKDHQNEDGSWNGADARTAMTGLALLCYMAHGETPASEEFGMTVEKAIRYLLYAQSPNGRFKSCGDNYSYGHAIATYGLAESFGMTRMVMLKGPVERAASVIVDGQQEGGAWDYNYDKGARRDLSVSAWQIQALKASKLSGAYVDGIDESIEKAIAGVKSFSVGSGYLSYKGSGNMSPTLTAAGVLCMQLLGRADDSTAREGLSAIRDLKCEWAGDSEHNNTYSWYYGTQAFFQNGGAAWQKWNRRMLPMLVTEQEADGHWSHGATYGSCPVYDTTLSCLCLEVYYRYLPTYERVEEVKKAPKTKEEADIKISIMDAL